MIITKNALEIIKKIERYLQLNLDDGGWHQSFPNDDVTEEALNTIIKILLESAIKNGQKKSVAELTEIKKEIKKSEPKMTVIRTLQVLQTLKEISKIVGNETIIKYAEKKEKPVTKIEAIAKNKLQIEMEKEMEKIKNDIAELKASNEKQKKKEHKDLLKDFKKAKFKVFVIMPFASEFNDVWEGAIKKACDMDGFGYIRVDEISLSSDIIEDINNNIELSDFIIADVTGNNPNVMFEFGYAIALKKKPIVIRSEDDTENLPFDIKDYRYISYKNSWSGIEKLSEKICQYLKSTSNS